VYPPVPSRPVRTSTTGPAVLTIIGAICLVAAIVATVFAVRTFVGIVPLHVLDSRGDPGSAALGVTDVPGAATLDLDAGWYDIYAVVPMARFSTPDVTVQVTGPDGTPVDLQSPTVASTTSLGGSSANAISSFQVTDPGQYTLTATDATSTDTRVIVVRGKPTTAFLGSVAGVVVGMFLAIGLGVVGLGLTIGGGVWWGNRARARKRLAAAAGPAARGSASPGPVVSGPGRRAQRW